MGEWNLRQDRPFKRTATKAPHRENSTNSATSFRNRDRTLRSLSHGGDRRFAVQRPFAPRRLVRIKYWNGGAQRRHAPQTTVRKGWATHALRDLPRLLALWRTEYGQVLLVKLTLVALTLMMGAYNFRRVQPQLVRQEGTARLRQSAALELSLGLMILLVTGFLTGISP